MSAAVNTDTKTLNCPCREVVCSPGTPSMHNWSNAMRNKRFGSHVNNQFGRCPQTGLQAVTRDQGLSGAQLFPQVCAGSSGPGISPARVRHPELSLPNVEASMLALHCATCLCRWGYLPAREGSELEEGFLWKVLIH